MLLRIKDITAQGKELNFELDNQSLNSRISSNTEQADYIFNGPVNVKLKVSLQGSTVILEGNVSGVYETNCARCAGPFSRSIAAPINMVLKPAKSKDEQVEDINFGFYDGEVVNCGEISEEMLVLALPMVDRCESENCKETKESWVFGEEIPSNNPFKNIKLVH